MARGLITVKTSGLKEIVAEMEALGEHYDEILLESLKAMQNVIEDAARVNWITIAGGKAGDYVYDSIGQSAKMSINYEHSVVGTTGVYHIDAVASKHGKSITGEKRPVTKPDGTIVYVRDLNAPQIGYWVEFGTSRLRNGGRKVSGVEYDEKDLIVNFGKPFLSNAAYQTREAQNKAFIETFNRLADKYK